MLRPLILRICLDSLFVEFLCIFPLPLISISQCKLGQDVNSGAMLIAEAVFADTQEGLEFILRIVPSALVQYR